MHFLVHNLSKKAKIHHLIAILPLFTLMISSVLEIAMFLCYTFFVIHCLIYFEHLKPGRQKAVDFMV